MGAKKLMTYGRYALSIVLVIYLLLVWLYFKDNALQLTSWRLLLWFVIIPLALFGVILFMRVHQKKLDGKTTTAPVHQNESDSLKQLNSYQLFISSSVCLPEGNTWSDIINNNEDLTTLSDTLTDFDGLPVLVKPIARVTDANALPYLNITNEDTENPRLDNNNKDEDDSFEDTADLQAIDNLTQRVWALLYEQFLLNDETLSVIAQHFETTQQNSTYEPNSALHIHPDWQQHYLVSADEDRPEATDLNSTSLSIAKLPIYLCIPALADAELIINATKQYLIQYGIAEALFTINLIRVESDSSDSDNYANQNDSNTDLKLPIHFIEEHLIALSTADTPELSLFIAADSQINEPWLESHLYSERVNNIIPTEASNLFLFCNKLAQDTLALETLMSFSLTQIGNRAFENSKASLDSSSNSTNPGHSANHYANNLVKIKTLLIDNSFILPIVDSIEKDKQAKTLTQPDKQQSVEPPPLAGKNITVLSDINPVKQPYDLSLFMRFIDEFAAQETLVNEHHLGHYSSLNFWLKPFLGLSLLVDLALNNRQQSAINLLITQHEHSCVLWLANRPNA